MLRTISANTIRRPNSSTAISRCPLPFFPKLNRSKSGWNTTGATARMMRLAARTQVIRRFSRLIERRRYRTAARTTSAAAKVPPTIRSASMVLPCGALLHGRPPPGGRHDVVGDHPVPVPRDLVEHRLHQRVREEVRLKAEVEELRVLRVVVVLLLLHPGVLDVVDLDVESV